MKHIKYIKEAFNQDDYYVKITNTEYSDLINNNNREIFNKREVNFFNNNTNVDYWVKVDSYYEDGELKPTDKFNESHGVVLKYYYEGSKIINSNINTYIRKLEDNYYVVYNKNVYQKLFYKCDQFEGLVQLLKNKKFI